MTCERCGKDTTVSLGTTATGEWFKCESPTCGYVFAVKKASA